MDTEKIKESIISILKEIDPITEFDDDTNLLEEILDSMSILYLLSELMTKDHIDIPITEITIQNFSTVNKILEVAEKYTNKGI